MSLSISQIRANTLRARHLYQRTRRQHFAVGAFNIDNQETLIAVARAAQKLNAPVLVEVSDGEVKALGLENIRDMVDNYREEYGVEMYINLDHSPTVEACKQAIDVGFEFIHIDIQVSRPGFFLLNGHEAQVVEPGLTVGALTVHTLPDGGDAVLDLAAFPVAAL